ncbi:MAG: glycoside hydrolase family 38 N-terminal domain-containing protein [Candidatus Hodarchaeales archaeon]
MKTGEKNERSKITVFICPHSHWDREWYLPFQKFRYKLIQMASNLLEYLEKNNNYYFTFDGQSIIIEDIQEIAPEVIRKLSKYTQEKKVVFGPWYVLPDEFLVSGESLTRNLQLGIKIAKELGNNHWLKVGYVPDLFGHIAQLPEIFNQFGLNHIVLWRGVPATIKSSEFFWYSPSGRNSLVTFLFENGYSNGVFLPSQLNDLEHELIKMLDRAESYLESPYLLVMNGTDHTPPQVSLGELFQSKNELKFPKSLIRLTTLDNYCFHIGKWFNDHPEVLQSLPRWKSELRDSTNTPILSGVLSARIYLKQANVFLERLHEDYLFPLNTVATLLGLPDLSSRINYSLKLYLQNHSHDCICGCSIDEVHEEMMMRFSSSKQWGESILSDLIDNFSQHLHIKSDSNNLLPVVLLNPHSFSFKGEISVEFEAPISFSTNNTVTINKFEPGVYECFSSLENEKTLVSLENESHINLMDYGVSQEHLLRLGEAFKGLESKGWYFVHVELQKDKKDKPEVICYFSRKFTVNKPTLKTFKELFNQIHISQGELVRIVFQSVPRWKGKLLVSNIPPFSHQVYYLTDLIHEIGKNSKELKHHYQLNSDPFEITILSNGQIDLTVSIGVEKFKITNFLSFEDVADSGDEYNFSPISEKKPLFPQLKEWKVISDSSFSLTINLDYVYDLPIGLTTIRDQRATKTIACPLNVDLVFYKDVPKVKYKIFPRIDCLVSFENEVKDHRLRAVIKVPFKTNMLSSSSAYYVITREIMASTNRQYDPKKVEQISGTVPQGEFSTVKCPKKNLGLTIINDGLPEIEFTPNPGNSLETDISLLKLTLLRCVGWLSRPDLRTRRGHAGPELPTPKAQCQGVQTAKFHLIFHHSSLSWAKIFQLSKNILSPPIVFISSTMGIKELPNPFFQIKTDNMIATALETRKNKILIRVVNYSSKSGEFRFTSSIPFDLFHVKNLHDLEDLQRCNIENMSPWEICNFIISNIIIKSKSVFKEG